MRVSNWKEIYAAERYYTSLQNLNRANLSRHQDNLTVVKDAAAGSQGRMKELGEHLDTNKPQILSLICQ